MAATLACGDGALLSHYTAAVLWGLRPSPAEVIHVTVTGRNIRGPESVCVHRIQAIHPYDATRRQAIRVTSPARTLLDLATQVTRRDLARAAEEAHVLRLVTESSLTEQFSRYPAHRGRRALMNAIRPEPGAHQIRSRTTVPRAGPQSPAARTADERADRALRGGLLLARARPDRRDRRLRVPLVAWCVRAGSAKRRRVGRVGSSGDAGYLAPARRRERSPRRDPRARYGQRIRGARYGCSSRPRYFWRGVMSLRERSSLAIDSSM